MSGRPKTEEFIDKARGVHGGKYDYSKVVYVKSKLKVPIICMIHGDFAQTPCNHLKGAGCPCCGTISGNKITTAKILKKKFEGLVQPKDYKLIPLTKGKFAMVDNEDFDLVKDINWYYTGGYAHNNVLGRMHRYIMNAPDHLEVDHKEHDTLDNRRSNLRLATRLQNTSNKKHIKGGSSRFKGVSWYKRLNKWKVSISINRKYHYIGSFTDEQEAAKAYDKKAIELRGEWAYQTLNFPELLTEYLKEI